jgi:D-alanyl-D-alanine carboxypeptidase
MSSEPRAPFGAFARAVSLILPALLMWATPAAAHHHHHRIVSYGRFASATEPDKDAALVADGQTGKVLYARNADALRHPASLTKMMTLYLLFDAL